MENQKIIDALYFSAAQCAHCYDGCQRNAEKEHLEQCMKLDKDCEDICRLTGQILERDSENAASFLKLCEEICEKCAAECEKHEQLEYCKKCAEACHKCAEACRNHQLVH